MMQTLPRPLLVTLTREPFQPVRLTYTIPNKAFVTARLRPLQCVVEAPQEQWWQWLFEAEAKALELGGGYDQVPPGVRPIVLARLQFPERGGMVLQTNSVLRAIGGARFFSACLGPQVVATRVRIVNRLFSTDEGATDELMKNLDRDVTVVDPRAAEEEYARDFEGARTQADLERIARMRFDHSIAAKKDVPLVEDFPLAPEEETPDFRDLTTTLQLRAMRAIEHWRGNTHLTLTAIIRRAVEQTPR